MTDTVWAAANWSNCSVPDRVLVRYLAGWPLENGQMAKSWARVVAMLSAGELPPLVCACEEAHRELHRWQFDLSRAAGEMDEQYSISQEDLNNPWGTRRGQVLAYKQARGTGLRVQHATLF